jgi:hypothetical protein
MAKTAHQRAAQKRMDDMHERLADEIIARYAVFGRRGDAMTYEARAIKDLISRRKAAEIKYGFHPNHGREA